MAEFVHVKRQNTAFDQILIAGQAPLNGFGHDCSSLVLVDLLTARRQRSQSGTVGWWCCKTYQSWRQSAPLLDMCAGFEVESSTRLP